ncbi:hypothetical protein DAIF1_05560 [Stenotrophomonas indicatrix]|jgi:hypothetical protein|nr:hypothetical protein DAIF1_05560 [Stenotrophomonas indicatrix]
MDGNVIPMGTLAGRENFRNRRRLVLPILSAVLLAAPFLHSVAQVHFLLLLAISFTGMAWLGEICARLFRLETVVQSPAVFTRVLLGQAGMVILWLVLSPLTWGWRVGLGLSSGLPLIVLILLCVTLWTRRRFLYKALVPRTGDAAWTLLALLGGLLLIKAATHYSFRAGALGLDTHQHIAFTLDLFNAGYPKLTAGHSDWLEKYPKMLHLISALWAWPGFGAHIGPFVKIQPVLQATLAVFAFAEVTLLWMQQRAVSVSAQRIWAAALVVLLGYAILRGTLFLYPVDDLNSTGRLAAFSTLLLPALCAMLAWLEPNHSRRPWLLAWLSMPLAAAMAAKLNPSLAIGFVSFSAPAWALLVVPLWWRAPAVAGKVVVPMLGIAVGGVLGGLLLFTDPYYLQLLAEALPPVRRIVEQTLGLHMLATPAELSQTSDAFLAHIAQVLRWELWYGPQPVFSAQYLPESQQLLGQRLLPITRLMVALTVVLGIAMLTIAPETIRRRRAFAMLVVAQFALIVAVAVALRISNITTLALGHETLEASLLSTYTQRYIGLLSMYAVMLHWILLLASLVTAADAMLQWRLPQWSAGRVVSRSVSTLLVMAALTVVVGFITIDIKGVTPADQGWTFPITEAKVRAFQRAESQLPQDAVVLAPAYAIVLNGREDWVLPSMYVTPYLPFAQRDYLFNVRLGSGYGYFAKDLRAMFCRSQVEQTRAELHRAGVTHLLVHRWNGQSDERALDGQYCLTGYRQLGAGGKPVATGPDGLVFYRLDP